MNAATSIHAPNRIAAGVTAAYLLDLTRRPAKSPGDGRRAASRAQGVVPVRSRRGRHDCERQRAMRTAAVL